jgi:hypothetical protein
MDRRHFGRTNGSAKIDQNFAVQDPTAWYFERLHRSRLSRSTETSSLEKETCYDVKETFMNMRPGRINKRPSIIQTNSVALSPQANYSD